MYALPSFSHWLLLMHQYQKQEIKINIECVPCHFITCADSSNHPQQAKHKLLHHQKDLLQAVPL